jgi:hypothetical protein
MPGRLDSGFLLVAPMSGFIWHLFMDRAVSSANRYIDERAPGLMRKLMSVVALGSIGPITVGAIFFCSVSLVWLLTPISQMEAGGNQPEEFLTKDLMSYCNGLWQTTRIGTRL